jgi:cbb3-type cytochrome oxidase subunit 3
MDNTIYIVFGILAVLYLWIVFRNRGKSKDRRSRKFMDDYERKDKKK